MAVQRIHDPYFADGYLLEAGYALARGDGSGPLGRRVHASVRVVLFAALSAEAHVNLAIATGLSGGAQKAADGLGILQKLQLVPHLAVGRAVFDYGTEPLQGVGELVRKRNALVHARPPVWEFVGFEDPTGSGRIVVPSIDVSPREAARWVSSLCRYLVELEATGVSEWRNQAAVARRIRDHDRALRAWDQAKHASSLMNLLDQIVDADEL